MTVRTYDPGGRHATTHLATTYLRGEGTELPVVAACAFGFAADGYRVYIGMGERLA